MKKPKSETGIHSYWVKLNFKASLFSSSKFKNMTSDKLYDMTYG